MYVQNGRIVRNGSVQERRRRTAFNRTPFFQAALVLALALLFISRPSRRALLEYLSKTRPVWRALEGVVADFKDFYFFTTARLPVQGRRYLGIAGLWLELPRELLGFSQIGAAVEESPIEIIIGINVVVFAMRWLTTSAEAWRRHFTASTWNAQQRPWSLALASVAHEDPAHLFANLSTLASVGSAAAALLGGVNTLLLYLAGGVAGSATSLLYHHYVVGVRSTTLGASGAAYALLGFCAAVAGNAEMAFFGRGMPALQALVLNVAKDAVLGRHSNVDFAGHAGGLALGVAVARGLWLPVHPYAVIRSVLW